MGVVEVVEVGKVVEMEGIRLDSTLAPPSQRRRRRKARYHQLCTIVHPPPAAAAVEQTLQRQDFLDQFRANTATSWQ